MENRIGMCSIFLLFTLLCLPISTYAATLQAEARASTEDQAKREALASLSDSILVEVQSESNSFIKGTGEHHEDLRISSRSDIPLIGVEITTVHVGGDVLCEAKLDSSKSLALYSKKLNEMLLEIKVLDERIDKSGGNDRYLLLTEALTVIEQYDKYRAVAQLLGDTQFTAPLRSRIDTEAQLRTLEKLAPSIEVAAQVLTKGLKAEAVYIYPAAVYGSHEITSFGRVVRDKLAQKLLSVGSTDKAQSYLKGEYEILDNGIQLTYRLLDNQGNTIETRMVMLDPSAYSGLQFKPVTVDFDRLLHEGVAVGNDFQAKITSNRGNEDLLFNENEEVELLVKLTRPGYFYVVGHVVKKKENYSYLLELSQAVNNRKFIRYINADDVNKWLSIGRFETASPYGIESIQLIASSDDPINNLPMHPYNKKTELYVTATNAIDGVRKTRALKHKHTEDDKQYQTEAVLMFTTMANK